MKKNFLAILLTVCMVFLMASTALAADTVFTDVKAGDWFAEEVSYVYDNGLMNGVSDKEFDPNGDVIRAMVWTTLARLDGENTAGSEPWWLVGQQWAVENGISDGTMANDNITREQLVTMFYRYAQYAGRDVSVGEDTNILSYTDALSVSEWAIPAMQWACGEGIINGINGALEPQSGANRAQMAAMFYRFDEQGEGSSDITDAEEYTVTFMYNYDSKDVYKEATVEDGKVVGKPANPTRSGYAFGGWYTDAKTTESFDFKTEITKDTVLYAKWTKRGSSSHSHRYGDWTADEEGGTTHSKACTCGNKLTEDCTFDEGSISIIDDATHQKVCSVCENIVNEDHVYDEETNTCECGHEAVDKWDGTVDTSWYNDTDTEFVITTAEQLAGLAELVDGGNIFEDKTIKLGKDIDLYLEDENGEATCFDPIGSYRNEQKFKGTFDGQDHTIKNLNQNTWALNNGYSYGDLGLGLFGYVQDANIKNLNIDGASISGESAIVGIIAACSYGNTTYENITVTNSEGADYQYYAGGIVGWASGNQNFINCDVDASTTIAAQWGDFDNSTGGIIGGAGSSAEIFLKDCDVACRIDAYNDVTSSYQWYAYRRCGMLIGNTNQTSTDNGRTVAIAPQLTCENVTVTYGEWANYTYCEFAGKNWPYVRVQAGVSNSAYSNPRYGHPTDANGNEVVDDNHVHNEGEDHNLLLVFNQLFGGGQGVYGTATHDGVTVNAVVGNSDALIAALESGASVVLTENVKIDPANMSNAYGTTGINIKNGQTIDGGNNTLDIKGAGGTWDSGINTTGGLIKNLTITGSFRGIFINHNSTYSERVVLENVIIDGTTYTISCDQGMNQGLTAIGSTFNGWTSYAATLGDAKFEGCNFGEGNGYAFCRPFAPTEFVGCEFEEGFEMDPRAAVTFENCTLNGVALTEENLATLVTYNIANATVK